MTKRWVYHETEEPMIVEAEKAQEYYDNGWADSPAKFIKTTDFGVDPDDQMGVQALGETVEGVKDALNAALNLDEMDRDDLMDFVEEHTSMTVDGRWGEDKLREEVKVYLASD